MHSPLVFPPLPPYDRVQRLGHKEHQYDGQEPVHLVPIADRHPPYGHEGVDQQDESDHDGLDDVKKHDHPRDVTSLPQT